MTPGDAISALVRVIWVMGFSRVPEMITTVRKIVHIVGNIWTKKHIMIHSIIKMAI